MEGMPPLTLLWSYRRAIGIGVGALALVVGVWAYGHSKYKSGETAGEARITARWQVDTKARDDATNAAIAAARQAEATARANNAEVEREYLEKVNSALSDRESVYQLLQQARREVRTERAAAHTDSLIASQQSETDRARAIDEAIAGVVVEARLNADQLDALIAVVKGQMLE